MAGLAAWDQIPLASRRAVSRNRNETVLKRIKEAITKKSPKPITNSLKCPNTIKNRPQREKMGSGGRGRGA